MGKRVKAGLVRVVSCGLVIKLVSDERASRLLMSDEAEAVTYRGGFALQLVAGRAERARLRTAQMDAVVAAQVSTDSDGRASCCVMSALEAEAVAGLHGASKTKGMGDWLREQRVRLNLEAEDLVERAENKFAAFVPQGRMVA